MSILLSDLVTKLETDVPAEDSVPSATQYENAVKDAVRDFSERCGLEQIATLSVVSGTSTYTLASDFLKLISIETFANTMDGIIHSAEGIIPIASTWTERSTIRNGAITFYPIPRYTMARDYRYKAAWVGTVIEDSGNGDDLDYETMSEREARIILMLAQSIALGKQVNASSGDVLKYSLGAVSVDKGSNIEEKRRAGDGIEKAYLAACDVYNGQNLAIGNW